MSEMQEPLETPDNLKPGEYRIPTSKNGEVVGQIRCSRPNLKLIDFYRTSNVIACDVKPVEPPVEKGEVSK